MKQIHRQLTAALCPAVAILALGAGVAQAGEKSGVAKNIILFIGDGAQLEHEIATSVYLTGQEGRVS